MPSPEQELLQLAQLDIGISVALAAEENGQGAANLRASQKVIQARMRRVQNEIIRKRKKPASPREPFLAENQNRQNHEGRDKAWFKIRAENRWG